MSKRSYENHALLYYFSSFARSKTSSYSCGLYVFPIVGYAARNCGTDSPQLENEVLLIA